MACRRRHGITRSSTFKEEICRPPVDTATASSSAPSSPVASKKNHRDSPLSSGYVNSPFQHRSKETFNNTTETNREDFFTQHGNMQYQKPQTIQLTASRDGRGSSMDKRTQDIQETFKLQNKKTEINREDFFKQNLWQDGKKQSEKPQTIHEHQLMASRDVAIATAAKAKLLLREIKTVKADLAFAKERSCQLEEENKMLRVAHEKGDHPTDDDMIRLQLETLLAEKARLAHENSVYVRENSCLREIIKYHKLSMQDVVYLDEGIEEVAEINPRLSRTLSVSPSSPSSPENGLPIDSDNPPLVDSMNLLVG
ncbi:hypothetical protein HanXRQr2_Chr16g0743531 [Helianthus annuus]|uniref:Uncharacterized protein n=2 Tax=Helianthus annuus TaxID=4232 RepID=A0A251T7B6_HELAN|nr:hypothetical protein HanXRQr2_Chr16g0743531 [Helianthus annuus]KAJ0442367.1 hypothetical protein HanIR_Chr16g0808381 [Helianthus annuus]KAJ0820861.1 hypothetical protein HanPSC8_Chr16g0713041 [Helianthus annuus]